VNTLAALVWLSMSSSLSRNHCNLPSNSVNEQQLITWFTAKFSFVLNVFTDSCCSKAPSGGCVTV